eukprot:gb/GEZN01018797.1/.p3 GENE.gb/GEZN01018797.1/~~gb/GEZN01018797.1/.p3  ORF type:complete len:130 (-),score=28.30 gb/GEZN01018797.1/:20-409(-)
MLVLQELSPSISVLLPPSSQLPTPALTPPTTSAWKSRLRQRPQLFPTPSPSGVPAALVGLGSGVQEAAKPPPAKRQKRASKQRKIDYRESDEEGVDEQDGSEYVDSEVEEEIENEEEEEEEEEEDGSEF